MLLVTCERRFSWEKGLYHTDSWKFDFGNIINWHEANNLVSKKWSKICSVKWCSVFDDVNMEYYEYDFEKECFERLS